MANTYAAISTVTVGSGGQSSINFNSIPQNYTDLVLMLSTRVARVTYATTYVMRFNGDTGSNYSNRSLLSDGSTVYSLNANGGTSMLYFYTAASLFTANTFDNTMIYIPNYTSSNYKSVSIDSIAQDESNQGIRSFNAQIWSSTSPITSISLEEPNGPSNFVQHSTATLYGIKKS